MSKLARVLALGALLAAMNLAGSAALAHPRQRPRRHRPGRPAAARRTPGGRGLAAPWSHGRPASRRRQPTAAAAGTPGRRVLAPSRDRGAARRTKQAARLAHPGDWCAGRAGALRRAGRGDHQAGTPQGPGRAGGLTPGRYTYPMGLPRPPGSPIGRFIHDHLRSSNRKARRDLRASVLRVDMGRNRYSE
jgi:hypothetical protein